MKKEIRFSDFLDFTEKFELDDENKIENLNLFKLNEYKDILSEVIKWKIIIVLQLNILLFQVKV